jgi:hypothetical protein
LFTTTAAETPRVRGECPRLAYSPPRSPRRLVAFAVDVDSANAAIAALPEMHRPSLCVRVDAMPRGPTGKVDRRRLLSDLRCGGGGARSRRENVYEEWVLQLLEGLVGATFDDDAANDPGSDRATHLASGIRGRRTRVYRLW